MNGELLFRGLSGQRALFVGGTSGIGLAAATFSAKAGMKVTVASRSPARVDGVRTQLGQGADGAVLDATDYRAVERFFSERAPFDHIVVSSASLVSKSIRELSIEDAEAAMKSKFSSAFYVARAARINSSGSLTFVSGILAQRPARGAAFLGAINAAIEGLARGLALELAPVRVNTVSPGRTDTPWWDRLAPDQKQALMAASAAALPVGRVGKPDDIAMAILTVMASQFMTGSTIVVDGGAVIA